MLRSTSLGFLFLISFLVFSCGDIEKKKKKSKNNDSNPVNNQKTSNNQKASNNGTKTSNNKSTTSQNNTTKTTNNNSTSNNNTSPFCGNGRVESGEICDGNCPTTCDDSQVCTSDKLVGSSVSCDAECIFDKVTACIDGDGCCPANCGSKDNDCELCGNGKIDGAETCDNAIANGRDSCPSAASCSDNDACTTDSLVGSAAQCDAQCLNKAITRCVNSDGCCPANCNSTNDNDCTQSMWGSACTGDGQCGRGFCLSESEYENPGGFCTLRCQNTSECGQNAFCSGGLCIPSCTNDSECRNSYACTNFFNTGKTCIRDTFLDRPGKACTNNSSCQGGIFANLCIDASINPSFIGGYCSSGCLGANSGLCQGRSNCTKLGTDPNGNPNYFCLQQCSQNSDCRGGYLCRDFDGNNNKECYPGAVGNGGIGDSCSQIQDCAGGENGFCASTQDGYCSLNCAGNASLCGNDLCVPIGNELVCIKACINSNDCRFGYECRDGINSDKGCFPTP